jgi:hypothetical protein
LAKATRQRFGAQVGLVLPKVAQALRDDLNRQLDVARTVRDIQDARDALGDIDQNERGWIDGVRAALQQKAAQTRPLDSHTVPGRLELLATEAVEDQLLASRLALSIHDKSAQEWSDLKLRILFSEGRTEIISTDVLRPESVARIAVDEWVHAGLRRETWHKLLAVVHKELSERLQEVYHEANRFLVTNGVMPQIDLRPLIRKATSSPSPSEAPFATTLDDAMHAPTQRAGAMSTMGREAEPRNAVPTVGAEVWSRARQRTQDVVGRVKRLLGEYMGGSVASTTPYMGSGGSAPDFTPQARTPSPALQQMLQQDMPMRFAQIGDEIERTQRLSDIPQHIEQAVILVRERSAELKSATDNPGEKATIEVVALMFQSILNEDRIPPALRVWFARLQIPVLRVALAEPEFFESLQHPARRLIDRMGSCALGFESGASEVSSRALEGEIKRIVQVIEQYPETGRRVFQLAFDEFQKFLAGYLQAQGHAGQLVSVAQQVEQKETLAVQYTIQLRKQLDSVPVHDGIADFFFKIWAEVLAVATVRFGAKHDETAALKKSASDLLWAASAKPTRSERSQVIARLPGILAQLRKGMGLMGLEAADQDRHIKTISDILAEAFMSRTATIPPEQLADVTRHMSSLEDFLPEDGMGDLELDQESIEMIIGVDASRIEVITSGGVQPSEAMRSWAQELQLGSWFMLNHNSNLAQVQLAWRSDRGQLCLFATSAQRYFLIQVARVGAYLQAGLLTPAEDESLTVRATRSAMEKIEANPERLLH